MRFEPTRIPDVVIVEPDVLQDERGFFFEVWHRDKFRAGGIDVDFVQDNHSGSKRGVLRGLHAQLRKPQGKLVRAIEGEIFDVAVDLRPDSPTFGRWFGATLSAANRKLLWVPPGLAHGFCALSDRAQVEYKCTTLYDPADEIGIVWNDPHLAIDWPIAAPIISAKDARLPRWEEVCGRLGKATGSA